MWRESLIILGICLTVIAIKVPVDNIDVESTEPIPLETDADTQNKSVLYLPKDEGYDTFLLPPYKPEETEVPVDTPATYLLPPAPRKHIDYYYQPVEPEQTDWYPIVSNNPKKQQEGPLLESDKDLEVKENSKFKTGKVAKKSQIDSLPPTNLVPPLANAQNDFIISNPSLDIPIANREKVLKIQQTLKEVPIFMNSGSPKVYPKVLPIPYLVPPKHILQKYYSPTKLYPKKFMNDFKPVQIPINQYLDESIDQVPVARPVKLFHPLTKVEGHYGLPNEDKKVYFYEKAENKKKFEGENKDVTQRVQVPGNEEVTAEQDASETNFRYPNRNIYSAPLKETAPTLAPAKQVPSNGERTEFRMHGMKGPHSYQFGYDTGKGKNRQFRYEERDNDGRVKGHYGYVDKHGKLRVVNYDADPEHGFRAEAPVEKE